MFALGWSTPISYFSNPHKHRVSRVKGQLSRLKIGQNNVSKSMNDVDSVEFSYPWGKQTFGGKGRRFTNQNTPMEVRIINNKL